MKRLLFLFILLPFFSTAQTSWLIQRRVNPDAVAIDSAFKLPVVPYNYAPYSNMDSIGRIWINSTTGQLMIHGTDGVKRSVISGSLVNITRSGIISLQLGGLLDTAVTYCITDATTQDIPVYVRAVGASLLDKHVAVKGYDYTDAVYNPSLDTIILTDRIFGVIRCTAGVWSFIGGNHDKEGIDSVTIDVPANNRLKVYFTKRGYYTGVGNIMADADNNYPFYNIVSGTSVSIDYFYVDMYQSINIQDSVYWISGTTFAKKTTGVTSLAWDGGTSTLTVNHAPFITTNNWPIMAPLGIYATRVTGISGTSFTMQFYDSFGNVVTAPDASCKFNFGRTSPNQIISDFATFASQPSTNLWIQGWMHKTIN